MTIKQKLLAIQVELKAPKNQRNKFGNYNYRNAEDILEALKPLMYRYKCLIVISDDIALIGDRYYVNPTITLYDTESDEFIQTTSFAREEESKKGMDGSQITGAASSYARKYGLNGMFDIDDTKDSDSTNTHDKEEPKPETVRDLKKDWDACEKLIDAGKLWDSLNESEKKVYYNHKESAKLRIRKADIHKEVSKLTAKNYMKNFTNIYEVIDILEGEEKQALINAYNDKMDEVGVSEHYEPLPFGAK